MLKTNYFRLYLTMLIIGFNALTCNAADWKFFNGDKNYLSVDKDSIIYSDNGLYYNIRYFDHQKNKDIIAVIQSKNGQAGLVKYYDEDTYKYRSYIDVTNKEISKGASNLKTLTDASSLYKVDLFVHELYNKNPDYYKKSDLNYYLEAVQRKIKLNWHPEYSELIRNNTKVKFTLNRNGSIISPIEIIQSSGSEKNDKLAIQAVKDSAPFDTLPSWYKEDTVNIEFFFDYKQSGK